MCENQFSSEATLAFLAFASKIERLSSEPFWLNVDPAEFSSVISGRLLFSIFLYLA